MIADLSSMLEVARGAYDYGVSACGAPMCQMKSIALVSSSPRKFPLAVASFAGPIGAGMMRHRGRVGTSRVAEAVAKPSGCYVRCLASCTAALAIDRSLVWHVQRPALSVDAAGGAPQHITRAFNQLI
jgi:hypothetical protein